MANYINGQGRIFFKYLRNIQWGIIGATLSIPCNAIRGASCAIDYRFWVNFHPNAIDYRFWPNFHHNAIDYGFWPNFHPNAIDYRFWPNSHLNAIDYGF